MATTKAAAEVRQEPQRLLDLGAGLAIWRVHVDDLAEQALNARVMKGSMFSRLSETIGRDKRLESLPLCALTYDGDTPKLEIVSGHHRVRAARASEVHLIHVIADETGLTRDQIAAKQLAHNSIAGSDEDQLIARIYSSIQDVDARLEAFISDQQADAAPPPVKLPRMDLELGYRVVTLVFLPGQADAFDTAVEQIVKDDALGADYGELALVDMTLFERWQAATRRYGKEYDARALSVVVAKLIDAAAEHLGIVGHDPADVDPDEWVAICQLLKSSVVPPAAGATIEAAVKKMTAAKQVEAKAGWRVLEILAADYLER